MPGGSQNSSTASFGTQLEPRFDLHSDSSVANASITDREFPHPSGEELFRFYQAYTIPTDTQQRIAPPDGRSITVLLPSVEVSVAAAATFSTIVATLAAVALWNLLLGRCGSYAEPEKAKHVGAKDEDGVDHGGC